MNYPTTEQAKANILDIGKRMYDKNFVAANDGNISCKISKDAILVTPTGVSKGFMTADMLIEMDLEGNVLKENSFAPSSEIKMHLRVYKENSEVHAVTHAHPPISSSFAIAGIALNSPIMPEAVVNLGIVPVAKYATPGSTEVPDSIALFCKYYNAVLLANHGALTWGKDIFEAFYRLESVEYFARVTMYTSNFIQKANVLSDTQIAELLVIRENLGIKTGGIPKGVEVPTNTKDVL